MPVADVPVIQDQGIMISDDIVAIEQASIDMLKAALPCPNLQLKKPASNPAMTLCSSSIPGPCRSRSTRLRNLGWGRKRMSW